MSQDASHAATTPSPALQRIGQIAIPVNDLDRAVGFYRDVLGLRLLFQAPPGLAFFNCGGVRLMLTLPEGNEHDRAASIIYYVVDDLELTWRLLAERGAQAVSEPHLIAKMPDHDLWMGFVADGEGNTVGLMCEVRAGQRTSSEQTT